MSHPFSTLFEKALKKSTPEENLVLKEAENILEKGYAVREVGGVLRQMILGRIDDGEAALLREALEAVEGDEY